MYRYEITKTGDGGAADMNRCKRYAFLFLMIICIVWTISGCQWIGKNQNNSWLGPFDTLTNLTIYDSVSDGEQLFKTLDEMMVYYDQLFDIYHQYEGINNLKTINDHAGISPVKVDQAMIDMLKLSQDIYALSEGRMNIAMGSVLSIWHEYREAGMENPESAALPEMSELEEAAKHTDISKMIIDEEEQTVYLEDPKMSLDAGAVAKGFAARKMGDLIRESGTKHALLDMSSSILAVGSRSDGQPWHLALQDPFGSEDPVCVVNMKDMSFVTSGDYQRYYEVEGQRYHHIIDPDTLMPADRFASVSIISADAGLADALSTALFCMTLEDGEALVESLDDTEALWIGKDGGLIMTSGFKSYVQ